MGEIVVDNSAEPSTADKKDIFPNAFMIMIHGYYTYAQK